MNNPPEIFNVLICFPGNAPKNVYPFNYISSNFLLNELKKIYPSYLGKLYLFVLIPNGAIVLNKMENCDLIIDITFTHSDIMNKLYEIYLKKMIIY